MCSACRSRSRSPGSVRGARRRDAALVAARRQGFTLGANILIPDLLREQGRLAALLGRRDEAIEAYRRYLDFRLRPEPVVQAEVDAVRAELARLTAANR